MPFNNPIISEDIKKQWSNTNFNRHVEDFWETIQSPGVPRDGIPPLDHPLFKTVSEAIHDLPSHDAMIVIEGEREIKVYRVDDVMLHEIVNDSIDNTPIAVTFCPLCNSAIVYKRMMDQQILRLGVSGMLRHNDLVMWDDVTESWWQQLTGEGIAGEWTGRQLEMIPSYILSGDQVVVRYPAAKILTKTKRDPLPPAHQTGDFKERGAKMVDTTKVMATFLNQRPVALDFEQIRREKIVHIEVDDIPYVIFANSDVNDMGIEVRKDSGQAFLYLASIEDFMLTFAFKDGKHLIDKETESEWNVFGEAIAGPLAGEKLKRVPLYPHFKKPWFQFYPQSVYLNKNG